MIPFGENLKKYIFVKMLLKDHFDPRPYFTRIFVRTFEKSFAYIEFAQSQYGSLVYYKYFCSCVYLGLRL
jgi:hypothetical protein